MSEEDILRGHFDATRRRFAASDGPILVLHDTTEFSWQRKRPEAVGFTTKVSSGKDKFGRDRIHTVCGLLMHLSLAVTTGGLPLGIAAIKFWNRKKFKGTAALKRKVNPTRVPIEGKESMRWLANLRQSTELLGEAARCVHIADREGDIWELFCLARELDTHFLIRRCVDPLAGDGSHKVSDAMAEVKVQGLHRVAVRDDKGRTSTRSNTSPPTASHTRPMLENQPDSPLANLRRITCRMPSHNSSSFSQDGASKKHGAVQTQPSGGPRGRVHPAYARTLTISPSGSALDRPSIDASLSTHRSGPMVDDRSSVCLSRTIGTDRFMYHMS